MSSSNHKRVVAVTGGTRGIGRAIAELFHERGDAVAVCARKEPERALPRGVLFVKADVRGRKDQKRFVKTVLRHFGSLHVFVNCAGVSRWRALEDIDEKFIEDVIQTNLLGTLWGCAAASSVMERGGSIVNLSSLAGKRGSSNNSAYCAAKFAVNGITQSLAKELGPQEIRVNAVCPVYVETGDILAALGEPSSPANGQGVRKYLNAFAKTQTALGRLPTPTEVAETVYFLSSTGASAITGQCLNVDCGTLPQ